MSVFFIVQVFEPQLGPIDAEKKRGNFRLHNVRFALARAKHQMFRFITDYLSQLREQKKIHEEHRRDRQTPRQPNNLLKNMDKRLFLLQTRIHNEPKLLEFQTETH
jgi:hypothetical protein